MKLFYLKMFLVNQSIITKSCHTNIKRCNHIVVRKSTIFFFPPLVPLINWVRIRSLINNTEHMSNEHTSMRKERVREEEEEPVSPMGRVFQSRGIDYCAVTMIGFKTKIKPDVVLDALKNNVYKHPRFSSKLVHSYTYHTHVILHSRLLSSVNWLIRISYVLLYFTFRIQKINFLDYFVHKDKFTKILR